MWKSVVTVCMAVAMVGMVIGSVWAQETQVEFDPTKYTCKQFAEMLTNEQAPDVVGMGMLWMSGYAAGALGFEKSGPLTQQNFESLVTFLVYYAQEKGDATLLDAVKAYVKIKEE